MREGEKEREASAPSFLICTGIAGKGVGKSGDIIIRSIPFVQHSFTPFSSFSFLVFHIPFFQSISHTLGQLHKSANKNPISLFYGLYLVSKTVCFTIITRLPCLASVIYAIFYSLVYSFAPRIFYSLIHAAHRIYLNQFSFPSLHRTSHLIYQSLCILCRERLTCLTYFFTTLAATCVGAQ